MISLKKAFITSAIALFGVTMNAQRIMENLGRGFVAVKTDSGYFLSWRFLGTEYASGKNYSFDIYKDSVKVNQSPITNATCFNDHSPGKGVYSIRTLVDGKEQQVSQAMMVDDKYINIPLKLGNYYTHFVWPGDLDGDGEYDLVCLRKSSEAAPQVIEGYTLKGEFLWRVDMGPNSVNQAPGVGKDDAPPASICEYSLGGYRCRDGVTVYDLNGDGKAEVFIRTAAGVMFADGKLLTDVQPSTQFISVVDGMTGKEITRAPLPADYAADGPMSGQFGIAYLDGVHPSLITKMLNRASKSKFNTLICAWDYNGRKLTLRWKFRKDNYPGEESHQLRILDVNGDGKDEIYDGSYVVTNDGKFLYAIPGAVHGDRFQITDIDPDRPGLEGYAIQQAELGHTDEFPWVYYEAATGKIIKTGNPPADIARGTVADVDPRYPGCEMFCSAGGLLDCKGNIIGTNIPVPNFKIWWDGDLLSEILDKNHIAKWDYMNGSSKIIFTATGGRFNTRNAIPFYGDILGDWREEVIVEKSDFSALMIFTTTNLTNYRLYTLPHNPAYRLCFTVKGYLQSTHVDYYLGEGMALPPKPLIVLNKSE
jgi:rhamnogalacturonan endolyase